jgi:metallo-beta-lactamase family protein
VLAFLGGVRTVTGSRFLLEHGSRRVLVDCGLYQGLKDLRLRNWAAFPVDPGTIDAVVVTHAHLDHVGYLPRLCTAGFRGPVLVTAGTAALAAIVLPDSGHLQEEEAAYANRMGFSKHRPALPLYTEDDAIRALDNLQVADFSDEMALGEDVMVTFGRAGHILGSATVRVQLGDDGPSLVFSGDLGRPSHPLLGPPDPLGDTDWVVVESTYGDRRHDDARVLDDLAGAISRTVARGGSVIIPAFAVDRTEVVLYHLAGLRRAERIPDVPVYVDSPMALDALAVYRDALAAGAPDLRPELVGGADPFADGAVTAVRDVEGSKRLNDGLYPSIIVSASGMATGGRVVHHLFHRLPDPRNCLVLVGFQSEGTRGRLLADGARQVKLLGQYVRVRAEVLHLPAFSVHADAAELIDWLATAPREPSGVFVVHGEETASLALAERVDEQLGWMASVPHPGERVRIDVPAHRSGRLNRTPVR